MAFFHDSCVGGVLESSCTTPYTPVLCAPPPCSRKKNLIFRGALNSEFMRPRELEVLGYSSIFGLDFHINPLEVQSKSNLESF